MAQQSNKKIKRRRRADYLKRKKEQAKLGGILSKATVKKAAKKANVPAETKPAAKKAVKKAPAKKAAKKVAKKAAETDETSEG